MTKREVEQKLSELRRAYTTAKNAGRITEAKHIEAEGKRYKDILEQMSKPCANCHKHPRINMYFCEKCEVRK